VDDACFVSRVERERDGSEDRERLANRNSFSPRDLRPQRMPVDVLEHHVDEAVGGRAKIVNRHGVRMSDASGGASLSKEAPDETWLNDVPRDDLDCDHIPEEYVSRLVHGAHTTLAEEGLDLVDPVENLTDE
jgi:hypothetical protein